MARNEAQKEAQKREPVYVKRIRLKNIRCFEDAELSFERDGAPFRPMTLIVGENGAGKTTLLRALALTLMPYQRIASLLADMTGSMVRAWQSQGIKQGQIELDCVDSSGQEAFSHRLELSAEPNQYVSWETSGNKRPEARGAFVCAYGVNRAGRSRGARDSYEPFDAVRTLFRDDASLLDPEVVLQNTKLAELEAKEEGREPPLRFEELERHLQHILRLTPEQRILVSAQRVAVQGPWGAAVPFHSLGDGYRGVATWLLDYFAQAVLAGALHEGSPAGVVLIDEIDEHLHPSWRRELVPLLRKYFPRTQFIGTTHSAISLLNCEPDEIAVCKLHGGKATLVQDLPPSQGRTVQELLSGEWFGMEAVVDDRTMMALQAYKAAVAAGEPEEQVAPLREKVRDRLGVPPATVMDELAIRAAALVRQEYGQNTRVTEGMVREAADKLRAMLRDKDKAR